MHALSVDTTPSTYLDEILVLAKDTHFTVENGGRIVAPDNYGGIHGWPAVRVNAATFIGGSGGSVDGSKAGGTWYNKDGSLATARYTEGGDGIHLNNGGSTTATAARGEFYDGFVLRGGGAWEEGGRGGSALFVNEIGTEAHVYGGAFEGGEGRKSDGKSLEVSNRASVYLHSGSFDGQVKVVNGALLTLYGCFQWDENRRRIYGSFVDGTELKGGLDMNVRTGGRVDLVSVSEQVCDVAPSTEPTQFPTVSPQPTVPRSGGAKAAVGAVSISVVGAATAYCGL